MARDFNPNRLTFDQGATLLKETLSARGITLDRIVTSRDREISAFCSSYRCSEIPDGFSKWQLPMILDRAQFFVSVGTPNSHVATHSHDEGPGVRVIISGSIVYNGTELTAGDWMYIPAGAAYSFIVGPFGVHQFYCYQCCCK